tara:strand:+ start:51 stop:233 length:183 start_codon:yes stop_codon:yes gene_type:complete
MSKLTDDQMIKIIKNNPSLSNCTDKEKKQIYVFAFGEEYMKQPDDMKGTLQTYREQTNVS